MTKKEVTEIFSVLMLAYPRAEMFQGGIGKLGPTISLWSRCLEDVDFWTGQQAVIRVCRECTFPPTIAEFRAAAEAVTQDVKNRANGIFSAIRSGEALSGNLDALYAAQLPGSEIKAVIDELGGTKGLVRELKSGGQIWNIDAILRAAEKIIRQKEALPPGGRAALPDKR